MIKVLYIATSDTHLATFHKPYIRWLKEQGCQVDIAVENRGDYTFDDVSATFNLPFPRSILPRQLVKTYCDLKEIINGGAYDLIHCHTPMPSVLARLASISARRKGTKVLYTAHGFHFFRGGGFKNWVIHFPAEYLMSAITDGIVTINMEDYRNAEEKLLCKRVYKIKGIGVDSNRFKPLDQSAKNELRTTYGYNQQDFILLYTAEFIPRKNHEFIIQAIPELKKKITGLKVIFAGKGITMDRMKSLTSELKLNEIVVFLGFRDDVHHIASISDIGISASKQEGLGLGLVEQMMCRVPVVASIDRGHKEFVEDGINGYLYPQNDTKAFIDCIIKLYENPKLRANMGFNAYDKALEFDVQQSLSSMSMIYNTYLGSD